MKKIFLVLICITPSLIGMGANDPNKSDLYLINQIEMVIFDSEDSAIITTIEIERPSLSGGHRTKDDIVFERLVYLDAQKHKIPSDDEAVDAYFMQIQREYNLTREELENIFTSSGYTIEEGRDQLKMMQTINTMLDIKIRSNLIVPRREIESYYNNHPEVIEASYVLQRAFVPYSRSVSKKKLYSQLMNYALGKIAFDLEWSEPFTLNHSEVADNKQFIYLMEPDTISVPQEIEGGFELFKLVEKEEEHVKTLEESYRDIADILRRPKYDELMNKYRETLFNNVSIVYFEQG